MRASWMHLATIVTVLSLVAGCVVAPPAQPSPKQPAPTAVPPTVPPLAATFTSVPPTSTLPPPPTVAPTVPPTSSAQAAKPVRAGAAQTVHETITSQALAGSLAGDPVERGYFVFRPPSYADGNKRYPVVYILHGATGDEYQMTRSNPLYLGMLQKGTVQEMILAFPDGSICMGAATT